MLRTPTQTTEEEGEGEEEERTKVSWKSAQDSFENILSLQSPTCTTTSLKSWPSTSSITNSLQRKPVPVNRQTYGSFLQELHSVQMVSLVSWMMTQALRLVVLACPVPYTTPLDQSLVIKGKKKKKKKKKKLKSYKANKS